MLPVVYSNQRILTTHQIAEKYGTDTQTIHRNFSRNKDHYIEGKHFFCLEGEILKQFKADYLSNWEVVDGTNPQIEDKFVDLRSPKLYLWTKKGAFLHAKSVNTDEAWDAYDQLVDSYFDALEEIKRLQTQSFTPLAGEWPADIADDPRKLDLAIKGTKAKEIYLRTLKALRYPELAHQRTYLKLLAGPKTPEVVQATIIRHLSRLGPLTANTLYNSYMKRFDREEVESNLAFLVEQGRVFKIVTSHSVKYFVPDITAIA